MGIRSKPLRLTSAAFVGDTLLISRTFRGELRDAAVPKTEGRGREKERKARKATEEVKTAFFKFRNLGKLLLSFINNLDLCSC